MGVANSKLHPSPSSPPQFRSQSTTELASFRPLPAPVKPNLPLPPTAAAADDKTAYRVISGIRYELVVPPYRPFSRANPPPPLTTREFADLELAASTHPALLEWEDCSEYAYFYPPTAATTHADGGRAERLRFAKLNRLRESERRRLARAIEVMLAHERELARRQVILASGTSVYPSVDAIPGTGMFDPAATDLAFTYWCSVVPLAVAHRSYRVWLFDRAVLAGSDRI